MPFWKTIRKMEIQKVHLVDATLDLVNYFLHSQLSVTELYIKWTTLSEISMVEEIQYIWRNLIGYFELSFLINNHAFNIINNQGNFKNKPMV